MRRKTLAANPSFLGATLAAEAVELVALRTHKLGLMQQRFLAPEGVA
jgi:hypothetical protein